MAILKAIQKQHFDSIAKHNWPHTYWAFDLHGTIIKPNYEDGNIPTEFYPHALDVLQMLNKREDICMYIFTCSHPHEQEQYVKFFKYNNIDFKWVNKNPEVPSDYGFYEDKPYFNVLFEDKAGFDPEQDWVDVKDYFNGRHSFILRTLYKIKRFFKNDI